MRIWRLWPCTTIRIDNAESTLHQGNHLIRLYGPIPSLIYLAYGSERIASFVS
jgi:hypothetical protein